jgi:hypothetical protein
MLTFIVFAIVIGLCFLGLGVSIFFKKNGKFPETEVGHNKEMRKRGITCAKQDEIALWKKTYGKEHSDSPCMGCGVADICVEKTCEN